MSWTSENLKKMMAEMAIDQAIKYLNKNPERNLRKMLDFAEKLAWEESHKEGITKLRSRIAGDTWLFSQVKRLSGNPTVVKKFIYNWVVNSILVGAPRRQEVSNQIGAHVPTLILVDPTSACNLKCTGCWAGEYAQTDRLEPELLDRIFTEAKELGIYWITLSGGEPFAYKPLMDLVTKHEDIGFMAYTNGTLITDAIADRLASLGNFSPAISLEGWEAETNRRRGSGVFQRVINVMKKLHERGVLFGTSITVTRNNFTTLFSDEFIDFLIEQGVMYIWSFHYIPVGRDADMSQMLLPEQRAWLYHRVNHLRKTKPILIADFWNDGNVTKGCIAGGRIYFHINAAGDVEPCAFAHFAVDNIKDKPLRAVLNNPLFASYQNRIPFYDNYLAPCPIIDNPQALRDIIQESGAHPTHAGAEDVLTGETAAFLDSHSADWRKTADEIAAIATSLHPS